MSRRDALRNRTEPWRGERMQGKSKRLDPRDSDPREGPEGLGRFPGFWVGSRVMSLSKDKNSIFRESGPRWGGQ